MIRDFLIQDRNNWLALAKHPEAKFVPGDARGAWMLQEFVLRNGCVYQGQTLPSRYKLRLPKMCYHNARRLVLGSKALHYCEGFVLNKKDPLMAVPHAWALTDKAQVLDPTLQYWINGSGSSSQEYEYMGVVFDRRHLTRERRYSGVLHGSYGEIRVGFMCEFDAGFAAAMGIEEILDASIKSS